MIPWLGRRFAFQPTICSSEHTPARNLHAIGTVHMVSWRRSGGAAAAAAGGWAAEGAQCSPRSRLHTAHRRQVTLLVRLLGLSGRRHVHALGGLLGAAGD
mmetsp:Transcript_38385/g.103089  ORF Transcript_38385/g.103089 Transcript_38385/m.103089 type:complete len:100 (-) Transcript_38385:319-618(-)